MPHGIQIAIVVVVMLLICGFLYKNLLSVKAPEKMKVHTYQEEHFMVNERRENPQTIILCFNVNRRNAYFTEPIQIRNCTDNGMYLRIIITFGDTDSTELICYCYFSGRSEFIYNKKSEKKDDFSHEGIEEAIISLGLIGMKNSYM